MGNLLDWLDHSFRDVHVRLLSSGHGRKCVRHRRVPQVATRLFAATAKRSHVRLYDENRSVST